MMKDVGDSAVGVLAAQSLYTPSLGAPTALPLPIFHCPDR